jgi:hypothetical protein
VADFAMTEIDEVVFRSISGSAEDRRVPSGRDRSSRVATSGGGGIAQVSSSMRLYASSSAVVPGQPSMIRRTRRLAFLTNRPGA